MTALNNLSKKNVDPGQAKILAAELKASRAAAAVLNEVNVSKNPIAAVDGATAMANAIPESSLQWIVIGKKSTRIPLHNTEITALDVRDQDFGPSEVTVVTAAISTYAVLEVVILSQNQLSGGHQASLDTDATTVDNVQVGCVCVEDGSFYEIISIEDEIMRWKERCY
eukprot:COSAG01_NODE_13954_length_1514_cov_54.648057_2_plen_168_part_00